MRSIGPALLATALLFTGCGKKESPPQVTPTDVPSSRPVLPETAQPAPPPPPPPGTAAANSPADTAAPNPMDDAPTVIAIQELNTALRNYVSAKGKFPASIEELCKDPALAQKKFKLPPGRHFVIDQRGMQVTVSN